MTELVRVGAVAYLDEKVQEQEEIRKLHESGPEPPLIEPEEVEEIVSEYNRGEWRLVRLGLFADLLGEDRCLERFDSVHIEGVWFKVPHGEENVSHAREATDQNLDRLHQHLTKAGVEVSTAQLESVQFTLELDERLRAALTSHES